MKTYERTAVSEYLGDRIVYRNLAPLDARLPGLGEIAAELGLPAGSIPRKSEADYARVVARLLRAAMSLDAPGRRVERLVFVGDTRMNDSTAFTNLCQAGNWLGLAFIGSETDAPPQVEMAAMPGGHPLYLANRWAALPEFDRYCAAQGLPVDENTAVVVDLDKTALGARGRNAHVIDDARVVAVHTTVAGLLGSAFDQAAFLDAYDQLKQPEFHPFTADNQDYLAYICLVLGSGLIDTGDLIADVRRKKVLSFRQFIDIVDSRLDELPGGLAEMHAEIYAYVQAGDPTPFKAFRRNEYLETVGRMGYLPDDTPVETLLRDEIVLTQEVRQMAREWRQRGALLFGLSDKPDEASIPTADQARQGFLPIHRTPTHAVGEG
jgi:hypothetical protein